MAVDILLMGRDYSCFSITATPVLGLGAAPMRKTVQNVLSRWLQPVHLFKSMQNATVELQSILRLPSLSYHQEDSQATMPPHGQAFIAGYCRGILSGAFMKAWL